ncbi:hypothetical protein GCM10009039_34950 [Halocalculus aciditolerans]|uniref:Uncharacterized protein n=1 Tax=Halocalculus aciditolerans TaxID=1383812 RepID=A0A830FNQ0_9EURY|nr:hypothetical protein GCM10009039_34950 [Halocalculus aciditolerans]
MGFPGLDWPETLGPGRTFGGGWLFSLKFDFKVVDLVGWGLWRA